MPDRASCPVAPNSESTCITSTQRTSQRSCPDGRTGTDSTAYRCKQHGLRMVRAQVPVAAGPIHTQASFAFLHRHPAAGLTRRAARRHRHNSIGTNCHHRAQDDTAVASTAQADVQDALHQPARPPSHWRPQQRVQRASVAVWVWHGRFQGLVHSQPSQSRRSILTPVTRDVPRLCRPRHYWVRIFSG